MVSIRQGRRRIHDGPVRRDSKERMDENGEDKMKEEIETNYRQIKRDIVLIIETELERIKNDPDLQHLVQEG